MRLNRIILAIALGTIIQILPGCDRPKNTPAEMILFNGKIITVDENSSIHEAVAICDGKIIAIGKSLEILRLADGSTRKIDLQKHAVIPGIIEGHLHPIPASQSEYFQSLPDLHSMEDLFQWLSEKAGTENEWIVHPKFFASRLDEIRQPTIAQLDSVAPNNPVFLNGSYGGMVNTRALKMAGIGPDSDHEGIIKDARTGQPTGFIRRSAFSLLPIANLNPFSEEQKQDALKQMLHLYNSVGITSICSGLGRPADLIAFRDLKERGELTVRVFQNMITPFDPHGSPEDIRKALADFPYKTGDGDEWIRVGAMKVVLDGGILTGTAYLREPWGLGAKDIYGITDPEYRGVLNLTKDELVPIIGLASEFGWKFTAHVTGGGGVDVLLDAYREANQRMPISKLRHSIIHGNFFTPEAIMSMADLGIYADTQAAWYIKDADMLNKILGEERIKYFHPYRSLIEGGVTINGGSDHMVKYDSYAAINPYNPFLAMWSMVTRKTERGSIYFAEEAISRLESLKTYTINNAYASFEEDIKGSIEIGKMADLAVLSKDILTCPADSIKAIEAMLTVVDGQIVYSNGLLAQ